MTYQRRILPMLVSLLASAIPSSTRLPPTTPSPSPRAPSPRGKAKGSSSYRSAWPWSRSSQMPHQGRQEVERRRQQIERGQLTGSNGLVVRRGD